MGEGEYIFKKNEGCKTFKYIVKYTDKHVLLSSYMASVAYFSQNQASQTLKFLRIKYAQTLRTVQCCLELFVSCWKLSSGTWLIGMDVTTTEKSEMMQTGIKTHVQASGDLEFKLDF